MGFSQFCFESTSYTKKSSSLNAELMMLLPGWRRGAEWCSMSDGKCVCEPIHWAYEQWARVTVKGHRVSRIIWYPRIRKHLWKGGDGSFFFCLFAILIFPPLLMNSFSISFSGRRTVIAMNPPKRTEQRLKWMKKACWALWMDPVASFVY